MESGERKLITAEDFLRLNYTPDLTQAGIKYVCQQLINQRRENDNIDFDILRENVAQKAVELAFRRYLVEMDVPHQLVEPDSFSEPDYHGIALGGRRCHVVAGLVSAKRDIRRMRRNPELLIKQKALLPVRDIDSNRVNREDVLVFALISALVTRGRDDIITAREAGQPLHLIYLMPKRWSLPTEWKSLGGLTLKADISEEVEIEIEGQNSHRVSLMEPMKLPSRTRKQAKKDFFLVSHLHIEDTVKGRIGIHSPILDKTVVINPHQWKNVWLYGMEILMLGYIQGREFFDRADHIPVGSRELQARHGTQQDYKGTPVSDLRPIKDLFRRAHNWAKK